LFLLLIGWSFFYRATPARVLPGPPQAAATQTASATSHVDQAVGPAVAELRAAASETTTKDVTDEESVSEESKSREPEKIAVLSNEFVRVYLSSRFAGIRAVELIQYRATLHEESGPVRFDFFEKPALSLGPLPQLSGNADFDFSTSADGASMRFERQLRDGLRLRRTVTLKEHYRLEVEDIFFNAGSTNAVCPPYAVALGSMRPIESKARTTGFAHLGVDTLAAHGGEKVRHWGSSLPGLFGYRPSMFSCARSDVSSMPTSVTHRVGQPVSWAAVKNQFFVQIVAPEEGALDCEIRVSRNIASNNAFELSAVSGDLFLEGFDLASGATLTRRMDLYLGPKKYALLKNLRYHQDEVMEFGRLAGLCKLLLVTLNGIHRIVPNYGVAIILLTALIRFVFWPITRKSAQSMKKLQDLQPEVAKIREKYKDKPQKMNQEIMALYREHKVNPMAGCLPMVIQIPVFIALFNVLRSAIELRFARFLWVKDLSEPENLLAGVLPMGLSLNILPILMTIATIAQQRMTPGSGDRQQDRMMMLMPLIMLFIFYNMASALVLYWTASQLMTLAGFVWQRKKTVILAKFARGAGSNRASGKTLHGSQKP
ncbi:MAG: YidC/Oxa1 family insertase periplasmic-domain containing protein, partial [Kiritimatiellia bacterium]